MTTSRHARSAALFASLSLAALGLSCSSDDGAVSDTASSDDAAAISTPTAQADLPDVVVTYSVLAAVVRELTEGIADVVTMVPDGQDPHEFEPSAKDLETISNASFVVANGLDFEEGLESALEELHDAGGPVFFVSEHVTVREVAEGADEHGDEHDDEDKDEHSDEEKGHASGDPHLWLSPGAMLEMLPILALELGTALDTDLSAALATVTGDLTALDEEISNIMSTITDCELVVGHDEMGYFADRYGCETIGAVIPSFSTTSEASAGELVELKEVIAEHDAKVLFTSLGTPQAVAEQIAKETGAKVVEISTHVMGSSTSYAEFMRLVAKTIADALA
jgi:zinc/manganese transport system substrate-binding protein